MNVSQSGHHFRKVHSANAVRSLLASKINMKKTIHGNYIETTAI
jgi:hypothetical protein